MNTKTLVGSRLRLGWVLLMLVGVLQGCGGGGGSPAPTYTIGGSVTGLTGAGLVLKNGGDTLPVTGASPVNFTFATALESGKGYAVSVMTQPSGQGCTVTNNASGTVSANVTNVAVTCIDNVNATGYYSTGSLNVHDNMGNALPPITDLQGIVSNNRVMMFSTSSGLSYDGTFAVTGDSFNGTVAVYTYGRDAVTVNISGTITVGTTLAGSFTGTGAGSGSFSLDYANTNNQVADISRVVRPPPPSGRDWRGMVADAPAFAFSFLIPQPSGSNPLALEFYNSLVVSPAGYFAACQPGAGFITAIAQTNLYDVSGTSLVGCSPNTAIINTNYSGLATVLTDATVNAKADNSLIFMLSNGTYHFYGVFIR